MTRRAYRQEAEELTDMLRNDPILEGLRQGLRDKGLNPETCFLGGFMEDEEGREWGAVVAPDGSIFEYRRRTHDVSAANIESWEQHATHEALAAESYPSLGAAVSMSREST